MESSGLASILGFEHRQMMRYLTGHAGQVASAGQGNFARKLYCSKRLFLIKLLKFCPQLPVELSDTDSFSTISGDEVVDNV